MFSLNKPVSTTPTGISALPTQAPTSNSRVGQALSAVPMPVMILVVVIVLVAIIVYLVVKYKKGSLQSTDLSKRPIIIGNPLTGDFQVTPAGVLPAATNGIEFSYSIWMFVDNLQITTDHKVVLYRGSKDGFRGGNFFVCMDAKTNKLYALAQTNGVTYGTANEDTLLNVTSDKFFLKSTVDYVPLQRWVHVVYSIKDNIMSTFMDGDLYSVTSTFELPTYNGVRPLIIKPAGDILIGGKSNVEGVNGYLGNLKYFNFALTLNEAKVLYNKGPYKKSWLSYFGVNNVGVRSPLYRIDASTVK